MPASVDLIEIVPSKAKAWVGLIGSLVTFIAPLLLSVSDALPEPWPATIGTVLAVLTALGIYKAPYRPEGTVLAPNTAVVADEIATKTPANVTIKGTTPPQPPVSGWQNPWKSA